MNGDEQILQCMRSITRCTEEELRYQLGKLGHPLAESDDLVPRLLALERSGALRCELMISLGARS